MSGQDEFRPACRHCSPKLKDGLDTRRLFGKNNVHNTVTMISSLWEESVTGFRIIEQEVSGKESDVVVSIYCSSCGNNSTSEEFVFATKRYIYKYQKEFGTTNFFFNRALAAIHNKGISHAEPSYEDYLGEDVDDFCENCGEHVDNCSCTTNCEECGQPISECRCCVECGADSLYCGCYCSNCGQLTKDCECDD